MNTPERDEALTLEILSTIEDTSDVTQRHLADRMGVALGLANAYLKRCIRKGLVKIQHAPANRYLYYLTPKGFAEKSRLTLKYLSASLALYRESAAAYEQLVRHCCDHGWRRLALCGASELAEIAILRVREAGLEVAGVIDFDAAPGDFHGAPVLADPAALPGVDAVLFTTLSNPRATYDRIKSATQAPILVPQFLLPVFSASVRRETDPVQQAEDAETT